LVDAIRRPALVDIIEEKNDVFKSPGVSKDKLLGLCDAASVYDMSTYPL
jgi:hypothetical protein